MWACKFRTSVVAAAVVILSACSAGSSDVNTGGSSATGSGGSVTGGNGGSATGGSGVTGGSSGTATGGATTGGTSGSGGSAGTSATGGTGTGGVSATGGASTGGTNTGGTSTGGTSTGGTSTGGTSTGGTSTGGTGTGGTGTGGTVSLVLPIQRNGKYVLEFGSTLFEVDPQAGGRITRFELNGQNVVASSAVTGTTINWGSVFWPSPQSAWYPTTPGTTWPPITNIDSAAYTAALSGQTIVLTSPPSQAGNQARVSVVKRFSADLVAQAIDCEFTLKNEATGTVSWAPWQVTRVGPNGLTFFATGAAPTYNKLNVTNSGGITWFDHPAGLPNPLPQYPDSPKYIGDAAEPWVAHATSSLVFVQKFPSIAPAQFAPGEGEVEIYAINAYEEIEPQGAYTSLAPGATLTWTVRWYLRDLPANASRVVGNAALVAFARSVAQQ